MLGTNPNKKIPRTVETPEYIPSRLDKLKEELQTMDSTKLSKTLQKNYNAS